ncbi:MAG: DUF4173 domain-containing protein [Bacilli bacterium]|nr:DUF4173 domain-containing protein [Bacilli bacterium]
MKKLWIYLLVLCILNSVLLFNNSLGINVIIFTVPFLIYLLVYLKMNKLITNKKGLLFLIPILVLSGTSAFYSNVFTLLNVLVIPILYILFFVYTTSPTYNIIDLLKKTILYIFLPLSKIGNLFIVVTNGIRDKIKLNDNTKKFLKALLIVAPITILVLWLLTSADMVFGNYFSNIFKIFDYIPKTNIIGRITVILILFTYIGSTLIYSMNPEKTETKRKNLDYYTIRLLLTVLNIIYILFDIIQIRSLLLHHVGNTITYAEYARQGFFQLMFISVINLIIILLSKSTKETKYNKTMSISMIFLTLIIIVSSFIRMYLYESTYGYTILRLGVYIILITEVLLLIPTIIYIFNPKFKILRSYLYITIFVYTFINLFSIEKIITENNIKRYFIKNDIDIEYLENYNYDNIPQLYELFRQSDDEKIKGSIAVYFYHMKDTLEIDNDNIFEYSYSKEQAKKILDKVKVKEDKIYLK